LQGSATRRRQRALIRVKPSHLASAASERGCQRTVATTEIEDL
jgi:hypothetical protein